MLSADCGAAGQVLGTFSLLVMVGVTARDKLSQVLQYFTIANLARKEAVARRSFSSEVDIRYPLSQSTDLHQARRPNVPMR